MCTGGGTIGALTYTKIYGISEEEKHQMLVRNDIIVMVMVLALVVMINITVFMSSSSSV